MNPSQRATSNETTLKYCHDNLNVGLHYLSFYILQDGLCITWWNVHRQSGRTWKQTKHVLGRNKRATRWKKNVQREQPQLQQNESESRRPCRWWGNFTHTHTHWKKGVTLCCLFFILKRTATVNSVYFSGMAAKPQFLMKLWRPWKLNQKLCHLDGVTCWECVCNNRQWSQHC